MKTWWFAFWVGVMSLLAVPAGASTMPETITLTYVKSPFNLQNIVMREQRLLEKAFANDGVRIEWRVINSGAQQAQALTAGSLDVSTVMNTASFLMATGAGAPITIISGVARPSEVFALVSKPGVSWKIADLKGKTVVGPKGTVLHQMLVVALQKAGLTMGDIRFVNMDPASAMTAILTGKADAGLLPANLIIKAQAAGARVMSTATGLVKPNLVMVAREDFVKAYPEAVKRIVKTQHETLAWIEAHQQEALTIGAKAQDISIEAAQLLYQWSHFYNRLTPDDIAGMKDDETFLKANAMMQHSVEIQAHIAPIAIAP